MEATIDKAERLGRTRAALFYAMAAALIVNGAIGFGEAQSPSRLVAWLICVALVALNLTPVAAMIRPNLLKRILNDEVTREHRRRSLAVGFWTSIVVAAALSIVAGRTPLLAADAAKLIITASLSVALISFATLELRAGELRPGA